MTKTNKNIFGNKSLRRSQFDQALAGRLNVSPRRGLSGDPVTTGINIAQQDLNNAVNVRNEHDDDAELFSNLGKIAGDKPEGAAALFTGLMEGAAYGAKTKSTAKKQEALDKYDRVTDYFRKINAQAAEMKEWYQKREFAQQKYLPQVLAYAENIDKLDTQSQRLMAQSILDGWNRTTGDDYKLDTIDGSDPFVMTVTSKEGTQVIDVRDLFAEDEILQQKLAMKTPEYQMKLQEERQQKAFDNEMKERTVAAMEGRYGSQGTEENEFGSIPLAQLKGRGTTSLINTANAEINLAKEVPVVLNMLQEGEEIIKNNPNLGAGFTNYLAPGKVTKALLDQPTREAYEKLDKIANRIAETYIRSKGSAISDSERETIKKGLFDTSNLEASNKYNINSVRKELEIAKERGDFTGEELARGFIPTPTSFEKYRQSRGNQQLGETNDWSAYGKVAQ